MKNDFKLRSPNDIERPETFGEKCAGYLEKIMSSWTCVIITIIILIIWIIMANYNFIISDPSDLHLNLLLSLGSFLEANIILIADKRKTSINKRRADENFRMNQHNEEMLQELYHHEEEQNEKIEILIGQNKELLDKLNNDKNVNSNT